MSLPFPHIRKGLTGLALLLGLFIAPDANAACSSPTGAGGDIIYNGDENVMSYCDDTNWIAVRGTDGATAGQSDGIWGQVGSELNVGSIGAPHLTALNSTTVAFAEGGNISTYSWDGSTWSKVGNTIDIGGGSTTITALDSTTIAATDQASGQLRTLSWDGSDWSQVGNTIATTTNHVSLTTLTGSTIAYIDSGNDDLRTYSWDGSDWSQVGNDLSISGTGNPDIAALDSTTIAFIDFSQDDLRTYSWDGSDWSQVGNDLNISGTGDPAITALDSTTIAFIDFSQDDLRTYSWDGSDWSQVGSDLNISGSSNPALTTLDSSTVAFIDSGNDDLRTYQSGTAVPPDPSLVGHWTLDETSGTTAVNAANPGTLDGTYVAITPATDSIKGQIDNAIPFIAGNNEYIDIADDSAFDSNSYTLSAWARGTYPSTGDASSTPPSIEKILSKNINFTMNWDHNSLGGASCEHWTGGGFVGTGNASDLEADRWYHLACTYDSTSQDYIFYIDGVEDHRATSVGSPTAGSDNLRIGRRAGGTDMNFDGDIDDVRYYSRALSASEIQGLYAACEEGNMIYNADHHVPQYCAGGDTWTAMGPVRDGIDSGLAGHWKLDESSGSSITDSSGNGNTGTWTDGADNNVTGETTDGKINTALDFDNTDNKIEAGSDSSLDDIWSGGGTITAWVYGRSDGEGGYGRIADKSSGPAPTNGWDLYVMDDPGQREVALSYDFTGADADFRTNLLSWPLNSWFHVAVTYDNSSSSNDPKFYINGVEHTNTSKNAPTGSFVSDASYNFTIGNRANATDRTFDGYIDDVRVYDRIISPAEIMALYELGDGRDDPSLVGHWKLDETSGTTATDSSGNGNDGTLLGGLDAGTNSTSGKISTALSFDGTNDVIEVLDDDVLDLTTFTASLWLKADNAPSTSVTTQPLGKKATGSNYQNFIFSWSHQSSSFMQSIAFYDGSGWPHTQIQQTLSADTWYHLAGTYDGTDLKIYVNGVLDHTTSPGTTPLIGTGSLHIGAEFSTGNAAFPGDIDDVRVYNRALSDTEVDALYKMGIGHCTNPVGKKGELLYNDDAGVDALTYCDGADWQMIGKSN